MSKEKLDLKDFAARVERMCDFFITKYASNVGRDGSIDLKILEDLKEEAANIQFDKVDVGTEILDGLSDFMKGANVP